MKKIFLLLLFSLLLILSSCGKNITFEDNYNEETFGIIDIGKNEVKIMQITDLHLSYGFDGFDRKTYKMLKLMIEDEKPDVIVLTGDLMMSVFGKRLLKQFIKFMDQFKIPWGYALGNHEGEYHSMKVIADTLYNSNAKYLYYHYGPKLEDDYSHGYSNYKLKLYNGDNPILNLYILDTKANRTDGIKDDLYPYDYLTESQVSWFSNNLANDTVKSFSFMHIPLLQFEDYKGEKNEHIWAQGKDTGFFDAILANGKKNLGVFVGHDHMNNHEFIHSDIMLGYGVSSGFNAYGGNGTKGARFIVYDYDNDSFETYIKFYNEVAK